LDEKQTFEGKTSSCLFGKKKEFEIRHDSSDAALASPILANT
jgi:hypothetical protein